MKAYEQIAALSNGGLSVEAAKKAFKKWCSEVGYTEEQGDTVLFTFPGRVALSLLLVHAGEI